MFERNGRDYFEHVQPRYKVTDRIGDRAAQTFDLEPCAIIFTNIQSIASVSKSCGAKFQEACSTRHAEIRILLVKFAQLFIKYSSNDL